MTKIGKVVLAHYEGSDGADFWAPRAALLAQAALEVALSMRPEELRRFVSSTPSGERIVTVGDKALEGMRKMVRDSLLS